MMRNCYHGSLMTSNAKAEPFSLLKSRQDLTVKMSKVTDIESRNSLVAAAAQNGVEFKHTFSTGSELMKDMQKC